VLQITTSLDWNFVNISGIISTHLKPTNFSEEPDVRLFWTIMYLQIFDYSSKSSIRTALVVGRMLVDCKRRCRETMDNVCFVV